MDNPRTVVRRAVAIIQPFDELENKHIQDVLNWIDNGEPLFRIAKPDTPPKHLVSYFVLFDETDNSLMLIDHVKAQLWLPAGGHVEIDEDPRYTVVREAEEELEIQANFDTPFGDTPFFITVTQTVNADPHTDVSLWYVIKGNKRVTLAFDAREMNTYKWFSLDEILATDITKLDPHLHRFASKLKQEQARL